MLKNKWRGWDGSRFKRKNVSTGGIGGLHKDCTSVGFCAKRVRFMGWPTPTREYDMRVCLRIHTFAPSTNLRFRPLSNGSKHVEEDNQFFYLSTT